MGKHKHFWVKMLNLNNSLFYTLPCSKEQLKLSQDIDKVSSKYEGHSYHGTSEPQSSMSQPWSDLLKTSAAAVCGVCSI